MIFGCPIEELKTLSIVRLYRCWRKTASKLAYYG